MLAHILWFRHPVAARRQPARDRTLCQTLHHMLLSDPDLFDPLPLQFSDLLTLLTHRDAVTRNQENALCEVDTDYSNFGHRCSFLL